MIAGGKAAPGGFLKHALVGGNLTVLLRTQKEIKLRIEIVKNAVLELEYSVDNGDRP
jgi:hypothetical protein